MGRDFNFQQQAASSQEFVTKYKEEFGEDPLNYAAEAYDAAWFLARALKEAGSPTASRSRTRWRPCAAESYDGALGEGLTFEDQTVVVPGVVIEYSTAGEELLYEGTGE